MGDNAFKYIETAGLETEAEYPYKGRNGKCAYSKSKAVGTVSKFTDVKSDSAPSLKTALNKGPVSIAIEATRWSSRCTPPESSTPRSAERSSTTVSSLSDTVRDTSSSRTPGALHGETRATSRSATPPLTSAESSPSHPTQLPERKFNHHDKYQKFEKLTNCLT